MVVAVTVVALLELDKQVPGIDCWDSESMRELEELGDTEKLGVIVLK